MKGLSAVLADGSSVVLLQESTTVETGLFLVDAADESLVALNLVTGTAHRFVNLSPFAFYTENDCEDSLEDLISLQHFLNDPPEMPVD